MMNCEDAKTIVDGWEEGTTTPGDLEKLQEHLGACRDCSGSYAELLSFIERDCEASTDSVEAPAPTLAPAGLADGVMAAIGRRQRRWIPFSPVLAAAAAAIFVVGLGIGVFFSRQDSDMVTVNFELNAPQASSVRLAGDFNGWGGEGYELKRAGSDGRWQIKVPLKRGKVYVYNFVIDGTTWIPDPEVPAKIDDGFGGSGSLLRL